MSDAEDTATPADVATSSGFVRGCVVRETPNGPNMVVVRVLDDKTLVASADGDGGRPFRLRERPTSALFQVLAAGDHGDTRRSPDGRRPPATVADRGRELDPKVLAAAWSAWRSRVSGSLGPGPGFVEAVAAALEVLAPDVDADEVVRLRYELSLRDERLPEAPAMEVVALMSVRLAEAEAEVASLRRQLEALQVERLGGPRD